ncbi:hypothetical protein ACHAW5_002444 [Stephanodiscus triporus]|uniref:Long-chain fatty acid--CoA ligase n=1 Tax=Stephanodiscus triporus TaxID=2934178 RepID=A0ABD3PJP7_9STRA
MPDLPIIARARAHGSAVAFRDPRDGTTTTYRDLIDRSAIIASNLLSSSADVVALLVPAGPSHVAAQWGAWRAGAIVVPMCTNATEPEWEYVLIDSGASVVVVVADESGGEGRRRMAPLCARLGLRLIDVDDVRPAGGHSSGELPEVPIDRRAMIVYTSGTTSKPKGVVTTHAQIAAQIESLVEAWEWRADDRIPLFLPLHHIHGIINVAGCALWTGATIEPFAGFDQMAVLERVCADAYTLFMAVPTIYVRLVRAIEASAPNERSAIVGGFGRMRLNVSGSAALPASVHGRWTALVGQELLERYGMTEIGMAISNPVRGERRPGAVGRALPGVEVRLVAEDGVVVAVEGESGEIHVRGPTVFAGYWNRPAATAESFGGDGWFRTGDLAIVEDGYYRILGRMSVDIIKTGGYKISALEVEAALLEHPDVAECAVIGLPDDEWGEAVSAAVVTEDSAELELPALREWCKTRLSAYKVPRRLAVVRELPRNAMGKITKPAVRGLFG